MTQPGLASPAAPPLFTSSSDDADVRLARLPPIAHANPELVPAGFGVTVKVSMPLWAVILKNFTPVEVTMYRTAEPSVATPETLPSTIT
jgi:hypothetical protein